jgi:hypothetical protein
VPLGSGIWELLVLLGAVDNRAKETEGFPSELESMR